MRQAPQRLAKSAKLKSVREAGQRFGRVCATGIRMAAQCGVEVNGVDDQELLTIRRQAMSYLVPPAKSASLRAKLVMRG